MPKYANPSVGQVKVNASQRPMTLKKSILPLSLKHAVLALCLGRILFSIVPRNPINIKNWQCFLFIQNVNISFILVHFCVLIFDVFKCVESPITSLYHKQPQGTKYVHQYYLL